MGSCNSICLLKQNSKDTQVKFVDEQEYDFETRNIQQDQQKSQSSPIQSQENFNLKLSMIKCDNYQEDTEEIIRKEGTQKRIWSRVNSPSKCLQMSIRKSNIKFEYKMGEKLKNSRNLSQAIDTQSGQIMVCRLINVCDVMLKDLDVPKIKKMLGAQVCYPQICKLIKFEQKSKNQCWIFNEYISSGSVQDLQVQFKKFNETQIKLFSRSLFYSLQILHQENNIVHGNLKISNVLIDNNLSLVKLTDFYLFRKFRISKQSPCYAPETLLKNEISFASDIWCAGFIILQMIIGENPWKRVFKNNGNVDIRQMRLFFKQDIPILIPKDINPQLYNLLRMLLNPNPEKRPSASEVLQLPFFQGNQDYEFLENYKKAEGCGSKFYNQVLGNILLNQIYYRSMSIMSLETPISCQNDQSPNKSPENFDAINGSQIRGYKNICSQQSSPSRLCLSGTAANNTLQDRSFCTVVTAQMQDGPSVNSEQLISSQYFENLKQQYAAKMSSFNRTNGNGSSQNSQQSISPTAGQQVDNNIKKLEDELWKMLGLSDEIKVEQNEK